MHNQYEIRGMDCADCARHVEQEIQKLEGIRSVQVNFVTGKMQISSRQPITEQLIQKAVNRAGYALHTPTPQPDNDKSLLPILLAGLFILLGMSAVYIFSLPRFGIPLYILGIVTGGYKIARQGSREAAQFRLGMNFLMTLAVIGAMIIGDWLEGAAVIFLFAIAQYLEGRTMEKARHSIEKLLNQKPRLANVIMNHQTIPVPVEEVQIGQLLAVKPGELIPVDGKIEEGQSFIDQSSLTGESQPVALGEGDHVYGGTLNQNGYLEILAERLFVDSTFSKIVDLVVEAQSQKAHQQNVIDRFALYYTPVVIVLAVLIAAIPPLFFHAPFLTWFYRALVILVIACPCALVISTPVTIISGLTAAMRRGILIKGGTYLENFSRVQVMAFDKTGTLTEGKFQVQHVYPSGKQTLEQVLMIAASLENKSDHPIARLICSEAERYHLHTAEVSNFWSLDGQGIEGMINNHRYIVGNHNLFEQRNLCQPELHELLSTIEDKNHTAVLVGNQHTVLGVISIADSVRSDALPTIRQLKEQGIRRMVMLTGDNHRTAEAVARELYLDDYAAELLPAEKVEVIQKLKREFNKIAMVGDGVNDAPALACADIGIAMGACGSDAAIETADIALLEDNLSKLAVLRRISRMTMNLIGQNIVIALGLKIVFLLLAVLGLATLWMAVFADMGASLLVIFNGLRVLNPH